MNHTREEAEHAMALAAFESNTPFAIYRPRIARDGDKWICYLGDNIQEGVIGIGSSPAHCAEDFNAAWYRELIAVDATGDQK